MHADPNPGQNDGPRTDIGLAANTDVSQQTSTRSNRAVVTHTYIVMQLRPAIQFARNPDGGVAADGNSTLDNASNAYVGGARYFSQRRDDCK
jgi:hypothetical protein